MCKELLSTSPDNDPITCFFSRPSGHGCTNLCLGLLGMSTCWAVRSNSQLASDFTHNKITTPAAGQTLILPMPLKATIHNAMQAEPLNTIPVRPGTQSHARLIQTQIQHTPDVNCDAVHNTTSRPRALRNNTCHISDH